MTVDQVMFTPIGRVENLFIEPVDADQIRAVESRIIVDLALSKGLLGLKPSEMTFEKGECQS